MTTLSSTNSTESPSANRVMVVGAVSGVIGAAANVVVQLAVGEPAINQAIAIEEANAAHEEEHAADAPVAETAPAPEAHEALYSRGVQTVGGSIGLLLVGLVLGFIFSVVFARTRHRLPGLTDWVRARWLALLAFLSVALVPALKYPANPPAVGDPDTVGQRTSGYLALLVLSVMATALAVRAVPALRARVPASLAAPIATVAAGALLVVAFVVLPASAPSPEGFPADLMWRFRLASLGGWAAMFAGLGTAFGVLLTWTPRAARS